MKRVLITGGTGFIGANLARRMLADGHDVYLLVRPNHATWRIDEIQNDVHLREVDLNDHEKLQGVIGGIRPEWVFHLAAHGAYSWQTDACQIAETNFIGTINLVMACLKAGFESFINTGSSSEYGFKDHPPTETEWLEPNSNYAVAKASATLFCRHTAQATKTRITTLRLYSVYGGYEEPHRLIPTLIVHGLAGKLPPLVNPEVARDYIYIGDVINAYTLCARDNREIFGSVYNVGTGIQTTLRDVVGIARQALGIGDEPQWGTMPTRSWDTTCWVADSHCIQEELGWRASHSFKQGFNLTLGWFQTNQRFLNFYTNAIAF